MAGKHSSSVINASKMFNIPIRGATDLSEQQKSVRMLRSEVNNLQRGHSKEGEVFYNKIKFKSYMIKGKIPVPKTYSYIRNYNPETFDEDFKSFWAEQDELDEFVFKPNHLSQGRHVYSIHKNDGIMYEPSGTMRTTEFMKEVVGKVLKGRHVYRGFMLEETIHTHPSIQQWYDMDGIADLRVYMLYDVPLFGKLRLPTRKSGGYGNTGRNAAAFFVDVEKRSIEETPYMTNCSRIHPNTDTRLIGEQLPFCKEMIDASVAVAKMFKIPFHSVDLTVNEEGKPVVIEGEKIPLLRHFSKSGCLHLVELMKKYSGEIRG